jgi:gliding motility-associated-like protein
VLCFAFNARAQNTTNSGTEFYTAYMDHNSGTTLSNGVNGSLMSLYVTSTINTTGTVTIADGSFAPIPFTVTANQVTIVTIPAAAYMPNGGTYNKGVHIVTLKPVAIYCHIYASSVSGATLLLPVSTLGKDYFSINYTQISNAPANNPAYSAFIVVATEDNTTVQITTPAALTDGHAAGSTFTIPLNKGQAYQALSVTDLTGTKISSINSTTGGCTKIAVFSGSSKIAITCSSNSTSDNLFQQVYPTASWGKTYITVPLASRNYDVYRIVLSNPATTTNPNVLLNGVAVPLTSFTNGYYQFSSQSTNIISADQPIQVVQYAVTQGTNISCKNITGDVGDPEMIYINPLEQTLNQVTLYSTGNYKILSSFINVVIKTAAVPSFTLDGVPYTNFKPIPGNTQYSYAQMPVQSGPQNVQVSAGAQGTHTISANDGFNAIAYGFGSAESYGYAAGTNLINLNENITLANSTNTDITQPNGCVGVNYNPQLTLPYQTNNIVWDFKNGNTFTDSSPTPVSKVVKGSQTLYIYQYGKPIIYKTPGDTSIVATVFNPNIGACGNNDIVEFDFNIAAIPHANFTASVTCLGDSTVFSDKTILNGTTVKNWLWDFGDNTTAIVKNPTHLYANPGSYNVRLTVSNENGCMTDTVQSVYVNHKPVAVFTTSALDCPGQNITFTNNSTSVDGAITQWVWNYGDGQKNTLTSGAPFTHSYANAGIDTVTLTVITASGCKSIAASQIITIHPLPVVNFGSPNVCVSTPQLFRDSTTIADNTNNFTYVWNFGDANAVTSNPNTSTIQNPSHTYTVPAVYTTTLTVTSTNGCITTKTKSFTVYALPTAAFTVADSTCLGNVTSFTDKSVVNNGSVNTWLWDFGDGVTANTQNPTHTYPSIGNYNVQLTVSNSNSCTSLTTTKTIHISPLPIASFSYSVPDCATNAVTFTDKSTTAERSITSWAWDFGDGSAITNTSKQPFQHTYVATGTYTVNLVVTTPEGCSSSITQSIIVNPLPVVDFKVPDVCTSDTYAKFTDKSSIADHTESGFTYLWDFGDAKSTPGNPNTSTLQNPTHSYHNAGNFTVTLTITSSNGCVVSKSQPFIVNGDTPVAAFAVENSGTLCSMNDVIFDDISTVNFGNITKIKWYFDYANNPTDTVVFTKNNIPANHKFNFNYGLFNAPATKLYTVRMEVFSGGTCTSITKQNITVKANPLTTISPIGPLCQNDPPIQIAENKNGFVGNGVFAGPGVSSTGLFTPSSVGPGTYTVNYIFTAQNGCDYTTSEQVVVNPNPTASIVSDIILLEGGQVTLPATATGDSLTYQWTPTTGLNNSKILTPIASPVNNITYHLIVTNSLGCIAVAQVKVTVLKAPIVPNAFTPNSDGVNDTWDIKYLDTYKNATVDVFSRYGEKVYSSVGYATPWDGTYKGSYLPTGTYYYIINPKNGRSPISGFVAIIR